jgi:A/G-specific adenine glycosylase
MLQQTQVSRVVERFEPFLGRFPTVQALARAPEYAVMAEWSGMGYYRRARLLHRAACEIVAKHGGIVPNDPRALAELPGLGRYTAGALASICFGLSEPILDGNIRRVLMRLHARRGPQTGLAVDRWAWRRAAELVRAARNPSPLNEGLMELGATICTPRSPNCAACPLRGSCRSFAAGLQDRIPSAKPRIGRKRLVCVSVLATDRRGRLLVECRPDRGLWAGMWQAPTWEGPAEPSDAEVAARVAFGPGPEVARFDHGTTHRAVLFIVRSAGVLASGEAKRAGIGRKWLDAGEVADLALSNPQRRILLGLGGGRVGGNAAGVGSTRAGVS